MLRNGIAAVLATKPIVLETKSPAVFSTSVGVITSILLWDRGALRTQHNLMMVLRASFLRSLRPAGHGMFSPQAVHK
jgi:hypothetical protein